MSSPTPSVASSAELRIEPLTPTLGAEVSGIDLSRPLDDPTLAELRDAWARHLVLFFRDQELTFEQHKELGRCFGELHLHPAAPKDAEHPEILVVHGDDKVEFVAGSLGTPTSRATSSPDGEHPADRAGAVLWRRHALLQHVCRLRGAVGIGCSGCWCGLTAVHEGEQYYRGRYGAGDLRDGRYPSAEHPVVRTHPVTGRPALYVNEGFTTRIKELPIAESDALLAFLFRHCAQPDYHCRFQWRENSVAFWDNRCAQHLAIWDYYPETRHGFRVTIKGDAPFYDPDRRS